MALFATHEHSGGAGLFFCTRKSEHYIQKWLIDVNHALFNDWVYDMAWVQIKDSDATGSTPEAYTDTQGHATTMTVTSSAGPSRTAYGTSGGLKDNWIVGDEPSSPPGNPPPSEAHIHTFSEPVNVLRIDIHYLNNGDAANFAYTDADGNFRQINIQEWIDNGDAIVSFASDHSLQTGVPGNSSLSVIRGETSNNGTEGGTTTVEFYFPEAVSEFIVGKNNTTTTTASDAYGYRLYYDDVASVTCFCSGTLIETARGQVAIENLKAGDLVRTLDNGLQPIRWIGSTRVSAGKLAATPNLQPIRIRTSVLGPGIPARDLIVSPQHRILVRSKIALRMFGTDEVLIAARHLLEIPGIDVADDLHEVEYFHFLFDRHEIVFSNGAETESLFTGPVALGAVSAAAREEIFTLFPELRDEHSPCLPARVLANDRTGRQLAARHARNMRELVS